MRTAGQAGRAAILSLALIVSSLNAQTFINYRGPTGNGNYPGVGLLKEWPRDGLPLAWKFNPDAGWASPSMVDGRLYIVGGRMGQLWTSTAWP